jgi:hypothetical protein
VIGFLRIIGNNLILGRSVENSLQIAIKSIDYNTSEKSKWIKLLNLGYDYTKLFSELSSVTSDDSLSRVWILLGKISLISSYETGEKILEIADNLDKNRLLTEKRDGLLKAQKYKVLFLGIMTSIFLGIIAGLAPLFSTFVSIFRNVTISNTVLTAIPYSLYTISIVSTYFVLDTGLGKFNIKSFLFSSIAYIISYFITKAILVAIM